MPADATPRVAYVVKRYPRFSETFIVNEILAHEAAGVPVEIFSLYPPNDTHFQDALARVRAPVTYLTADGLRAADLWSAIEDAAAVVPEVWDYMRAAHGCDARVVYQAARLARAIVERRIAHVHAHFATVSAEVARLACAWTGASFSVTAHAKDIYHEAVSPVALRQLLNAADHVITVSDFNVSHLTDQIGVTPDRVLRLYNGLDLARFGRPQVETHTNRFISVGRLVPKKGLDDLVSACALLRDRGLDFSCTIVGGGPEHSRLSLRIEQLGLCGCVHLAGPMPQADVIRLVQDAVAFVAPCLVAEDGDRDGLPTVLLESMAVGTAVISTDVVGIPEVVRHHETGLLVPERAPGLLADAMERLLTDEPLRLRLADAARALMEQEFDVHVNAGRLRRCFTRRAAARLARAS